MAFRSLAQPSTEVVRFSSEVFVDVVKRCTYGELGQLWLLSGHLFLTSKSRLKVFSFDFIPASRQQISDTGPLGFYYQSLSSEVVDVVETNIYPHTVFVILKSGRVQCWEFADEYKWSVYAEFDLCNTSTGTEVVSVCMAPAQKAIYWCERRSANSGESATYCICKRILPEELEKLKKKDIGAVHALVHNCPASNIYIIDSNIIISTRPAEGAVHINLILNFDESLVTVFVGDEKIPTELSPRPAVDFRSVLVQCLPSITKTDESCHPIHIQFDPHMQQVTVLHSTGKMHRYHGKDGIVCTRTQFPDLSDMELGNDNWFLTQSVFGISTGNKLRLYSAKLGLGLQEVVSPDECDILGLSVSHIPTVLMAFFTTKDIYVLQRSKEKPNFENVLEPVPGKAYQTASLQVAFLNQEKQTAQSGFVVNKMSDLHRRWKDDYKKKTKSRLSQLVDPYLDEFWRLEELVASISDKSKTPPELDVATVEDEIRSIVLNKGSLPLDVQQAQITWLSEKYPDVMLEVLTGDLEYNTGSLDSEDRGRWMRLLGKEGDGALTGDTSLMLFEHVCRLMYKLNPQQLVQFLQAAQKVSEEAVGVSAFVRKRQTFQYYKKALDCLPEPAVSTNIPMAAEVKAHLILTCDEGQDMERSIKLLLEHQQWKSAITLIEKQPKDSYTRACLLYITMAALAQNQVLSDYAKDIFSLVPSCQSFLTFSNLIEKQPEVKQCQLSMSMSSVFCQGPPDIPVAAIRPILVSILAGEAKES